MTKQTGLLPLALALGGLITYIDTRPAWDDTGVTAASLLVTAGVLGFLGPSRPWLWALALGIWIPVLGLIEAQNYSTLLALAVAFVGAYGGMAIRRWALPLSHGSVVSTIRHAPNKRLQRTLPSFATFVSRNRSL